MGKTVKVYAVNAATVTNKMATVHDIIQRRYPDFVMISEVGQRKQKSPEVEGYTSFRTDHKNKKQRLNSVHERDVHQSGTKSGRPRRSRCRK